MTERDLYGEDDIRCDICNKYSGYNDNRELWLRDNPADPRPEWRCEICVKAVRDATEQRNPTIEIKVNGNIEGFDISKIIDHIGSDGYGNDWWVQSYDWDFEKDENILVQKVSLLQETPAEWVQLNLKEDK